MLVHKVYRQFKWKKKGFFESDADSIVNKMMLVNPIEII